VGGKGEGGYVSCLGRLTLANGDGDGGGGGDGDGEIEVLGVETVEEEEEEALFVDDVSDIDMDELLQGTQRPKDVEEVQTSGKGGEGDEFEDEMAALHDMDFDM
jgi:hypothetical protein